MGDLSAVFDTSVLTAPADGPPPRLDGGSAVSVVTVGELYAGVLLATDGPTQARRLRLLAAVLSDVFVLDVDRKVTTAYGELRMAASGRAPSNDLWIAATALAHDLELVTRDERQASLPLVRCTFIAAGR
jgi:predicted nucleic acid-binding protein